MAGRMRWEHSYYAFFWPFCVSGITQTAPGDFKTGNRKEPIYENNINNVKRIFDKQTKSWFEVSPEEYKKFDTWRINLRKREQYHGRCMYPRNMWWLCDGMCDDCEFYAADDVLSLDMPVSNEDGDEVSLMDTLVDPAPLIEDVICDKAELDQLFSRLQELMPEAIQIGQLRQEGKTDEAIAEIIGIARTTFRSRLTKAKEQLAKEFPGRVRK